MRSPNSTNPFAHMDNGNGYEKEDHFFYRYFDVQITQGGDYPSAMARFKKNIITRATYVFQANCTDDNCWNEIGYGWGRWTRV